MSPVGEVWRRVYLDGAAAAVNFSKLYVSDGYVINRSRVLVRMVAFFARGHAAVHCIIVCSYVYACGVVYVCTCISVMVGMLL